MRIVIDALEIDDDTTIGRLVDHLLPAWQQNSPHDELHVVVGARTNVRHLDSLVVHHFDSADRSILRRAYAKAIGVPLLCRSLRADALLGVRSNRSLVPLPCPRIDLVDPMVAARADRFTWWQAAQRLRVAVVDAVARSSWRVRRLQINPSPFTAVELRGASLVVPLRPATPTAPVPATTDGRSPHARRVRWVGAVSASTLALSAAAAASVNLATGQRPTPPAVHHATARPRTDAVTSTGRSAPKIGATHTSATPSTTGPWASPLTAPASHTTTPGTLSPTTTPTTAPLTPTATDPSIALPTLTLPILTLPTLSLPSLSCAPATSVLSILHACAVTIGGQPPPADGDKSVSG
jgi:hypothetical protein